MAEAKKRLTSELPLEYMAMLDEMAVAEKTSKTDILKRAIASLHADYHQAKRRRKPADDKPQEWR